MPRLVHAVAEALGLDAIKVNRSYRMDGPAPVYLQGVNEDTHGIADSLLSVLAVRAGEIVADILAS